MQILPRLYQVLNRITTYYGQQIEEVYESHDPTGEKRRALEADLDRKIGEEIEKIANSRVTEITIRLRVDPDSETIAHEFAHAFLV